MKNTLKISIQNFLSHAEYFDQAFAWLKKARADWSHNDTVWHFSRDFSEELPRIIESLRDGSYRFEPVKKIERYDAPPSFVWHARDAFVLKVLSLYFTDVLTPQFSKKCVHIKGNGGIANGLSQVSEAVEEYPFVFRSDIFSYYESMSHSVILRLMRKYTKCKKLLSLFAKFLNHLEDDGELKSMEIGISKGCPLSPLIGALYLSELDDAMSRFPVIYLRFQDDWIILAKKRWTLRKAIKVTNQILNRLKVIKHPDKTFIGRVERGFHFLGFQFNTQGVIDLAYVTKEKTRQKLRRLYEQRCDQVAIHKYLKHWATWVKTSLSFCVTSQNLSEVTCRHFLERQYFDGLVSLLGVA